MTFPKIHLHRNDIPADLTLPGEIAVDCEMMGLSLVRDRLCMVQLRGRDGDIHLVQIMRDQNTAPNLKAMLEDPSSEKIFHFGRIDIASIKKWLGIETQNIFCTKISSKLTRTYSDRHGLKELVREIIGIDLNKQQTTTNWGAETLTKEQLEYAASDVLYLHAIKDHMVKTLQEQGRYDIAKACFDFLPTRAALDLLDWEDHDIFAHS